MMEGMQTILTALLSIISAVLLAAIPWAFSVHGRMSSIETHIKAMANRLTEFHDLSERILALELKLKSLVDNKASK